MLRLITHMALSIKQKLLLIWWKVREWANLRNASSRAWRGIPLLLRQHTGWGIPHKFAKTANFAGWRSNSWIIHFRRLERLCPPTRTFEPLLIPGGVLLHMTNYKFKNVIFMCIQTKPHFFQNIPWQARYIRVIIRPREEVSWKTRELYQSNNASSNFNFQQKQ